MCFFDQYLCYNLYPLPQSKSPHLVSPPTRYNHPPSNFLWCAHCIEGQGISVDILLQLLVLVDLYLGNTTCSTILNYPFNTPAFIFLLTNVWRNKCNTFFFFTAALSNICHSGKNKYSIHLFVFFIILFKKLHYYWPQAMGPFLQFLHTIGS